MTTQLKPLSEITTPVILRDIDRQGNTVYYRERDGFYWRLKTEAAKGLLESKQAVEAPYIPIKTISAWTDDQLIRVFHFYHARDDLREVIAEVSREINQRLIHTARTHHETENGGSVLILEMSDADLKESLPRIEYKNNADFYYREAEKRGIEICKHGLVFTAELACLPCEKMEVEK